MHESLPSNNEQSTERPFGRFFFITPEEIEQLPTGGAYDRTKAFYQQHREFIHNTNIQITRLEVDQDGSLKEPNYLATVEEEKPIFDRTLTLGLKSAADQEWFHWQLRGGNQQYDFFAHHSQVWATVLMEREFDAQGRLLHESNRSNSEDCQWLEAVIWRMTDHPAFVQSVEKLRDTRTMHELAAVALREKDSPSLREQRDLGAEEKMVRTLGFQPYWIRDSYGTPLVGS